MIKKYFLIAVASMSILVVSCRQDDEIIEKEKENTLKVKIDSEENQTFSKSGDSTTIGITPEDPPKNGTHWKGLDSISVSDDPNDPPKNGTHWKGKN